MLRAFRAVGATPRTVGSPQATPSWSTSLCVLCVRASARTTHKLVEKYYLRRSRNVYGVLPFSRVGFGVEGPEKGDEGGREGE